MKIIRISAVWCPGCLVMRNVFKKIKENYDFEIIEYDFDMDEDDIIKYNVGDKLPVTIFLDDSDNELSRLIGEKSYDDIDEIVKKYIDEGV